MIRILIIEDDLEIMDIYLDYFHYQTDPKFEVFNVENVRDGLECIKSSQYDVILADYNLPDGVSTDITNHIKTIPGYDPLVIMLSGSPPFRTGPESFAAGVHKVFTKPTSLDTILGYIRERLSGEVNVAA